MHIRNTDHSQIEGFVEISLDDTEHQTNPLNQSVKIEDVTSPENTQKTYYQWFIGLFTCFFSTRSTDTGNLDDRKITPTKPLKNSLDIHVKYSSNTGIASTNSNGGTKTPATSENAHKSSESEMNSLVRIDCDSDDDSEDRPILSRLI